MPANQLKPQVSSKASSPAKTTFLADTLAAQETDKFARSLLKQLRETQKLAASPVKLEIKVGREINYRGMEEQAPEVSKLSPAAIAYLNAAIKIPQADPDQRGQGDKALNRAVTIKVDNEVVFRLSKGVVETNKLQPELAKQVSQAVNVDIQPAAEPAASHVQVAKTPSEPESPADSATVVKLPPAEVVQQVSQSVGPIPLSATQQESNQGTINQEPPTKAGIDSATTGGPSAKPLVADQVLPQTEAKQQPVSEPSPQAQEIAGDPSTPLPAVNMVPALDIVEREVQKQPEGSVRQYFGQAVQALRAASQLAGVKVQQRVKDLPIQTQAIAGKAQLQVQHQLKQLPQQVAKIPEVVRDRHIADTALQLLEKYGTRNDQGLSYQAADYTIQATGKNTYSISDNQGKNLMKFKQNFFGPQTLSSQMSQRQQKDFARAGSQIQIQGGTPFLPADPAMRVRQLQGLAPAADVSLARDVKNIAAVTSVQNVLQSLGRDRYQNDHYRFQQRGNALTVTAKDGRGEILSVKNGEIQGNLKPVDISYLRQLDRQVSQELAPKSPAQETAKQPELVP